MAVEKIELELIQDNPYQARLTYHRQDIDDLAHSIKTHGLLQVPPGRHKDGKVELGFGHLRKRAFAKLAKKEPEKWGEMPVDIKELSDEQMALFALEENLKRRDITPMETARAVDNYLNSFLEKTEVELAESLNMTKGNVSNMRRVLRLPEQVLEKIDDGRINFTQGRELLILERLENSKELMLTAIRSIKTEKMPYGKPNTVEGMQTSVHDVISGRCRPLDKEYQGYRWDLIFDTRAADCLECEKMIRTHPTKSATAHWCLNPECWEKKQEEHREKAAAAAKAKMEAEVLERAAKDVAEQTPEPAPSLSQYTLEKRGTSWIALDAQRVVVAIDTTKEKADAGAVAYFSPVATIVNPGTSEYVLNHTYRISREWNLRKPDDIFDVTAQDLPTAITALGVKREDIEAVRIYKSSGKLGTGGGVSAGWSKCTEPLEDVQEQLEDQADERDRSMEEAREKANLERPVGEIPCGTCLKGETCDRSFFHIADDDSGRLVCDVWECDHVSWALPKESAQAVPEDLLGQEISRRIAEAPAPAPQEIPEDILTLAREKAGTRADVLDINDICIADPYRRQVKPGYAVLQGGYFDELRYMDDPEECTERCTHGFHFGFDSKEGKGTVYFICSDTKCVAKKKAASTRARNTEGQARKKAEMKAVKEAIAQTTTLDRPRIKLILLAQLDGKHTQSYYHEGAKKPETWLWERLSAGTPAIAREREALFKRIDNLTNEELAKLVIEFMLYFLTDKGDIGTYEIKAAEPLKWMGIPLSIEPPGDKEHA
ncbi:Nucleoid occlusion protein [subsurface metagenome]